MWDLFGTVLVPIVKWIFEKIAKKKLNDKEFVEYIRAHQKKRGRAGDVAMEWEDALAEARKELEDERKNDTQA